MTRQTVSNSYPYQSSDRTHAHAYLLPALASQLHAYFKDNSKPRRLFDLGCGNGSAAQWLQEQGFEVVGVDPSTEGVQCAKANFPHVKINVGSGEDDLAKSYGLFPVVYSLEVIEHVYAPRRFAKTLFNLVEPGGLAIVTTPYHGYIKTLAVVASGKFDSHFDPLWDDGHIKFWSPRKLTDLLVETGFTNVEFVYAGRIRLLAKSMIALARKPESSSTS